MSDSGFYYGDDRGGRPVYRDGWMFSKEDHALDPLTVPPPPLKNYLHYNRKCCRDCGKVLPIKSGVCVVGDTPIIVSTGLCQNPLCRRPAAPKETPREETPPEETPPDEDEDEDSDKEFEPSWV